jgi:hypothetical protein
LTFGFLPDILLPFELSRSFQVKKPILSFTEEKMKNRKIFWIAFSVMAVLIILAVVFLVAVVNNIKASDMQPTPFRITLDSGILLNVTVAKLDDSSGLFLYTIKRADGAGDSCHLKAKLYVPGKNYSTLSVENYWKPKVYEFCGLMGQ